MMLGRTFHAGSLQRLQTAIITRSTTCLAVQQWNSPSGHNAVGLQTKRDIATTAPLGQASPQKDGMHDINSKHLIITKTDQPKEKVPYDKLAFGKTFTDHMLEVDWNDQEGWKEPAISPYHPLQIDPAASSLHYALQVFEGMKAYIDPNNKIRLFRPELNMRRMNDSMTRLQMPTFNSDEYLECLKELLKLDKDWIPRREGYSLYIRPTAISTHPFLGVGPSSMVKNYTILAPVGPYYPEGFAPVKLYADPYNVRAWPGGAGGSKIGSNYGPTIRPAVFASQKGYTQVLWLFRSSDDPWDSEVTEVGTMNLFVLWKNENGERELITAPLDGTILPGVTRQSVIELAKEWGDCKVSERKYTIREFINALNDGRVEEAFGSGTAAVVSPINEISFLDKSYKVPLGPQDEADKGAGPFARRVWDELTSIQYGRKEHEWSVLVD